VTLDDALVWGKQLVTGRVPANVLAAEVERLRDDLATVRIHRIQAESISTSALVDADTCREQLAALREQRCETCRHQGTWGDGTLVCQIWCDSDGYNAKCIDINGCLAWARREP
jgi:hypothetical protein